MGLGCIEFNQLNWNVPSEHNVYNNVVAKLIMHNCKCSIGAKCL
jgi:UDP-N-acetylmuramate-alanine ligase